MIPQHFIQDLVSRVDIVEVISPHVNLKKAGANFSGLCPFHNEKSPSFTVSPQKQFYHCFGCGAHGTAIGFLIDFLGMSYPDAIEELARRQGLSVPHEKTSLQNRLENQVKQQQEQSLLDVLAQAATHYVGLLKTNTPAQQYLQQRGLSTEIIRRYGIGYAANERQGLLKAFPRYEMTQLLEAGLVKEDEQGRRDRFRGRVMFPIRNAKGAIIGFGGRVLDKSEPKYLNSPETEVFHKGRELYGLYEARQSITQKKLALVVEGYMDVIALAQFGINNAVATLGTAVGSEHLKILTRHTDEVVFAFDGDAAGQKAAWRALGECIPHANDTRRYRFLLLPDKHDPDSYLRANGSAAFETELTRAPTLSQYLLGQLRVRADLETAEGRVRALEIAKPILRNMPDGMLQQQILLELAKLIQANPSDIRAMMQALQAQEAAKQARHVQGEPITHATQGASKKAFSGKNTANTWQEKGGAPRYLAASQKATPSLDERVLTMLLAYPQMESEFDESDQFLEPSTLQEPLAELLAWLRQNQPKTLGDILLWHDHEQIQQGNTTHAASSLIPAAVRNKDMLHRASSLLLQEDEIREEIKGAVQQLRKRAINAEMQVLTAQMTNPNGQDGRTYMEERYRLLLREKMRLGG